MYRLFGEILAKGLQFRVMGSPEIRLDQRPLTVDLISLKGQALLIYLAVTRRAHMRTALAGLLWGDLSEENARANLRYTLSKLRKHLPATTLITTRYSVALENFWLEIEEQADGREGSLDALPAWLHPYRGDFLEAFYLSNTPEYETWVVGVRERLRQTAVSLLTARIEAALRARTARPGIEAARQLLLIDPLHESAHRHLMLFLAVDGQQSAALAQYNTCRSLFEEELNIVPSAEITELYAQILEHQLASWSAVSAPAATVQIKEATQETPICVARERQLSTLVEQFDRLKQGMGQVCFVTGEAGQGKTTLVREFTRLIQKTYPDWLIVLAHNNALTGISDPYTPFRELMGHLTGTLDRQGMRLSALQRDALQHALPGTLHTLLTMGPDLIGDFVNENALREQLMRVLPTGLTHLSSGDAKSSSAPPGGHAQERLIGQITAVLKTVASHHPVILVIEDLHWMDVPSINLFFHLCREIRHEPLGILATYRTEEVQSDTVENGRSLALLLSEIKRLYGNIWVDLSSTIEADDFVNAYLDIQPNRYSARFRRKLVQFTRGHALFTVELLREMQARGDLIQDENGTWRDGDAIDWLTVPSRVEGAIESRLQRLSAPLLTLLQLASVEGETFTAELLATIQGSEIGSVIEQLGQQLDKQHNLIRFEGFERQYGRRITRYRFRHYLFRQYLYEGLDEAQRFFWHDAVGQTLESLLDNPDSPDIATQLAYHFHNAGNIDKAVYYLLLVGQQAGRLAAAHEAIAHLRRGLRLLSELPQTAKRSGLELNFQIALGNALIIAEGYTSPEAGAAYARARALCSQLQNAPQQFPVLYGSWVYHHVRAEHEMAKQLGVAWLALAKEANETAAILMAHRVLGVSQLHLGELDDARYHLARCVALYDEAQHHNLGLLYGQDPCVAGLMLLAWVEWLTGRPDEATEHAAQARRLTAQLDHPFSRAFMLIHEAILSWFAGDWEKVHRCADTAVQLCRHHGFPFWLAVGQILRSWSPRSENPTLGITDLLAFISTYRQTGAALWQPCFLIIVAQAYREAGQTAVARRYLVDAKNCVEKSGERMWQPVLDALK